MSTQMSPSMSAAELARSTAHHEDVLEKTAAAFGMSAAITIVFNTVLAWVKDSYAPLNDFMAALTGHHWRTHGIVDVLLFLALGMAFMSRGEDVHLTDRLTVSVAASVVIGGAGLAAWFLLV